MKRKSKHSIAILAILSTTWPIYGQFKSTPVNRWTQSAEMAAPRTAACSVQLADGRVLVAGGRSDAVVLNTVEVSGAEGIFSPVASMAQTRAGAACITLPDGRVLVTGGTNGNATLASAEVYDAAKDAWHSIGSMSVARAGHTATATSGGAVLLAGGEDTGAVELFLTNDTFLSLGKLATSRSGYAVTATIGHKVVIAGGSDGSNSALATVEIYDGDTGKLIPGGTMLSARKNFAAAPLLDGTVLLTGGYGADGAMLASSEVFDPERGTSVAGSPMSAARANHKSTVLPSNGRVLLVGGIDQNGETATAEIYTPWTRKFDIAPPMHNARQQMAMTPLRRGALVVAGGKGPNGTLSSSEVYAFATLDTDKADYAPGEFATFNGTGWKAGEQVLVQVSAFPLDRHSVEFTATTTADSAGRIRIAPFDIDLSHLGSRFLATATGSESQAQSGFAAGFTSAITTTASPLTQTVGQIVAFTSCVATVSGITPTGTITFKIGSPISTAIPLSGGCATFQYANLTGGNSTLGVTYSGDANYSFNFPPSGDLNLTVARAATTSAVTSTPANPVESGTSVQLTGTVTSTGTAANGFQIGGVSNATFQDNGNNIPGCILLTVNNGTVNCNLGIPTIGSHSIVLNFLNTDPNFLPSTSPASVLVVKRTATAGPLSTIPASPIVYNTSATVRAQFGPSGGGPALTGTVSFFDGATLLGSVAVVSGGNTDFALPSSVTQGVGSHSLTAQYNGDANYFASVAPLPATSLAVNKAPVNTSAPVLNSGALSATITPASGGGVPTGTITFTIDGVAQPPVAIDALGSGIRTVSLAPGSHTVSAAYSGDANFLAVASGTVSLTVSAATATAGALITIPASPIVYNTPVTIRAQFGPSGGGPALTGTVSFFDGATQLGTAAVVSGGNTDFALPNSVIQSVGNHSLTARYSGDTNYLASAAPFPGTTLVVNKASTNISSPVLTGGTTLSATITPASGGGVPTGTITFTIDGVAQSAVAINASAVGSISVSPAPGNHTFSASYSGDANFLASASGTVSLTVSAASATAGALITIPASPIVYNTPVTIRTQFGPSAGGPALTGTVSFFDGATLLGTAAVVSGGNTDFALPNSATQSVGNHSLTARYSGDTNYLASAAPFPATTLVVNKASTSISSPVLTGGTTLSATVTPSSAGAVPTGTVTFTIDGVAQSAVAINASGVGSISVSPAPGDHTFSASYSGDANFLASASATVTQKVSAPAGLSNATLTITSNPNFPVAGQTVTITVNVGGTGPVPTGTVQFFEGATLLGTAQLIAGQAILTNSFPVGSHSLVVNYLGDGNTREASASFNTVVTRLPLSLTITSNLAASVYGQMVTLTAKLAPQSPTTLALPAGTIQFLDGTTIIATGTLSQGTAVATVSSLDVGLHSIRAAFAGDATFFGANSTAVTVLVSKAQPTLTLTALPDVSSAPQVTVTATINVVAPGGGIPTGSVQFVDTATNAILGISQIVGTTATATLTALGGTSRTIAAIYVGTSNYLGAKSLDVTYISMANAASYVAFHASPDEIMTIFGANLASGSASASALPLPLSLAGTTVKITDQAGVDYQAQLYFASPTQINLLIPANVPVGPVRITVTPANGSSFAILAAATRTTPGLFTANSNGRGIAAAQVIRVASNGSQSIENVAKLDPAQQVFVGAPISFGSDQLFLALYGTGIRHAQSSSTVTCTVNGQKLPILFAGAHSTFVGLDQVNVQLPRTLVGAGQVTVVLEVDGQASNTVNLLFQ